MKTPAKAAKVLGQDLKAIKHEIAALEKKKLKPLAVVKRVFGIDPHAPECERLRQQQEQQEQQEQERKRKMIADVPQSIKSQQDIIYDMLKSCAIRKKLLSCLRSELPQKTQQEIDKEEILYQSQCSVQFQNALDRRYLDCLVLEDCSIDNLFARDHALHKPYQAILVI